MPRAKRRGAAAESKPTPEEELDRLASELTAAIERDDRATAPRLFDERFALLRSMPPKPSPFFEDLRAALPSPVREDLDEALAKLPDLDREIARADAAVRESEGEEREGNWARLERLRAERAEKARRTSFSLVSTASGPRFVPTPPVLKSETEDSTWPLLAQRAQSQTEWLLRMRGSVARKLAIKNWAPGTTDEQARKALAFFCAGAVNKFLRSPPTGLTFEFRELVGGDLERCFMDARSPKPEIVIRRALRAAGVQDHEVKRLVKLLERRDARRKT